MHGALGARLRAGPMGIAEDRALERAARCARRRRDELLPFRAVVRFEGRDLRLEPQVQSCFATIALTFG
jgi:hypothetical protein